ncbi:MAG: polyprenol monophosphomannose synthase [Anaerolineae bacterium]|nr:polyprenol monophosphomannose synthase [Anaerolineae bacterium]MBN8619829.1 polyprenol monophosphomannose synthase [Anaerolineae bacterium]
MPKTIIVLPTYNEKENLSRMVDELLALNIPNLHILVVDDNSPDGTGKIADEIAARDERVNVLHRKEKNGLGQAYIAGFKQAISMDADYIIQMDCDFSHQPKYIPDFLKAIESHDVVLGSRFAKGGSVDKDWSIYRKLLTWFANRVYTPTILGIPVRDATGGYRVWRRNTLIGLGLDRIRSNGYVFQVEMAYVASRLGFRIAEIPIYFPDRELGESKMDIRIQIEAAMRVWEVRQRHRMLNPQMRHKPVST